MAKVAHHHLRARFTKTCRPVLLLDVVLTLKKSSQFTCFFDFERILLDTQAYLIVGVIKVSFRSS